MSPNIPVLSESEPFSTHRFQPLAAQLQAFLKPLPGNNPQGKDLRAEHSADFVALESLRRLQEKRELLLADGLRPDWAGVAELAGKILAHESRDLEVACWWILAVTRIHGFPGLLAGLQLLLALETRLDGQVHPLDPEFKVGILGLLAQPSLLKAIKNLPLSREHAGRFISRADWENSILLASIADANQRAERLEKERWLTSEAFHAIAEKTPPEYYADLGALLEELKAEAAALEKLLLERYPVATDELSLQPLHNTLQGCLDLINRYRPTPAPAPSTAGSLEQNATAELDAGTHASQSMALSNTSSQTSESASTAQAVSSFSELRPLTDMTGPRQALTLSALKALQLEPACSPEHQARRDEVDAEEGLEKQVEALPKHSTAPHACTSSVEANGLNTANETTADTAGSEVCTEHRRGNVSSSDLNTALRQLQQKTPFALSTLLLVRARLLATLLEKRLQDGGLLLPPPATASRQLLRLLHLSGDWNGLYHRSETLLLTAEGSGWLDLHRYSITALDAIQGKDNPLSQQLKRSLSQLLESVPELQEGEFLDGTPTCDAHTRLWLKAQVLAESPGPRGTESVRTECGEEGIGAAVAEPDFETLVAYSRQASQGRQRFLRQLDLAEHCLLKGKPELARPLFQELLQLVEQRKLEEWEDPEHCSRVWSGVLRATNRGSEGGILDQRAAQQLFERLCRIDLNRAMKI